MAFPTVLDRISSNSGGASVTTFDVDIGSPSNGDRVVVLYGRNATSAPTTPSGWTEVVTGSDGAGYSLTVLERVCNGTEGATVTVSQSSSRVVAVAVRVQTGTSSAVEAAAPVFATSANPDAPSLSPSWGADDVLWYAVYVQNNTRSISVQPTGYSNVNTSGSTGTGLRMQALSRELNASSEDPSAWTVSGSDPWVATLVAIRGGAAASGGFRPYFITG